MTDRSEFDSSALQLLKETNVLYLSVVVCAFSIFLAGFVSIVVAVVVLFSFSAGLLVPYLVFREGKHVPNLLVVFLGPEASEAGGDKRRELRRSCSVCGGEQCSRQLPASLASPIPGPHHPHVHITVPRCVDEALDELLTLVLDEHVYSWYREFSVHDQLADEVRSVIRYAVCVLQARLQEVDLTRVITERLLPSLFSHLDQYVEGGRRVRMAGGVETSVLEYTRRAGWLHPALESREAEAQFLRSLVTALKPFLLPQKYQGSSVTNNFLKELLGRFLLLQLMDYLADPDTVNLLLLLLLNPEYLQQQQQRQDSLNQVLMLQSPQPHKGPLQEHALKLSSDREPKEGGGSVCSTILRSERDLEPVLLLKNFSSVNTLPRNSSLRNNLSAVLKDQTLLYLFHTFLKEESAINILQFCLAVEDFNRHILDPELTGGELQQLHSEAQDLYHSYMAPGAADQLPFPLTVVQQIRDMVHSEASAIVKLRTTRPLFQAYEFAYNLLEREYLPLFMNSHMYFAHLCGSRSSQACQKTSSRSKSPASNGATSNNSPDWSRGSSLHRQDRASERNKKSSYGHARSSSYGGNLSTFYRNSSTLNCNSVPCEQSSVTLNDVFPTLDRNFGTIDYSSARNICSLNLAGVGYSAHNGGLYRSLSTENTETLGLCSGEVNDCNEGSLLEKKHRYRSTNPSGSCGNVSKSGTTSSNMNRNSKTSKGVVQRVGSVGRTIRTFGASMMLKPQVVAGDEDLSSVWSAGNSEFYVGEATEETGYSSPQDEGSSPRGGRRGLEGFTSGSYRDLSAWRVTIPRLDYVPDPNIPSKMTHFFVIDVTRIDVTGDADGSEEIHWEVLRRFHEFYILESKLTEFHGEFQYNTLPSRRSLFTPSHASDFMLTRRQIFEEYLQKLLQTPALRRSQLLFLFLKSKDEFTTSFLPDVSLGRLLRDVPRKLVKERGQHLEPFIELFLQAAGPAQPQLGRKRSENLEKATEACESLSNTEELYPLHTRLYRDNARSLSPPPSQCLPTPPPPAVFSGAGITEMIMFIGVRVYGVGLSVMRWLVALNSVIGSTIDAALLLLLRRKLAAALTAPKMVKLIYLLRDALVEPVAERSGSARRRRELEFRAAVLGLLPPWFTRLLLDDDSYKEGANTLVNLFQHPLLNKQLSYVLLDQVLEEVFPELSGPTDGGGGNDAQLDQRPCTEETAPQPAEHSSVSSAEEAIN
ncbi:Phox-associated domain [Trinorchestia longiramus]|nr:Phox-associated domain [Trinorchestia longiramus]